MTIQSKRNADGASVPRSAFFTYTDDSAVTITAVGGSASINGDLVALYKSVALSSPQAAGTFANADYTGQPRPSNDILNTITAPMLSPYQVAAPTLAITAFNGDVGFNGSFTLYPAKRGTLELLSAGSIRQMAPVDDFGTPLVAQGNGITIADADPLRLPRPANARFSFAEATQRLKDNPATSFTGENDVSRERLHATYLLHQGDDQPVRIYAAGGDINFNLGDVGQPIPIVSAKPVWLRAEGDISDLQ